MLDPFSSTSSLFSGGFNPGSTTLMEPMIHFTDSRSHEHSTRMMIPRSSDSDRIRSDCNLTSLYEHIQIDGFNSGSFSDIVINSMGSTYHLHRLILSRSSYFRNMLQGPWKEANAQMVTLHIDDENVNGDSITITLAYLYGRHPQLNDSNAFRVLAAASFLDLQDLCAICTDFIISELWTSNFLEYQVFAESQDYGIYGERVRTACWGYLCQSGAKELKEVLPKLSSQTLYALLTSDMLWVPSEEIRFELALHTLLTKGAFCKSEHDQGNSNLFCKIEHEQVNFGPEEESGNPSDSSKGKGRRLIDGSTREHLKSELENLGLKDQNDCQSTTHNILNDLAAYVVDFHAEGSDFNQHAHQVNCSQSNLEPMYSCKMESPSPMYNSVVNTEGMRSLCSNMERGAMEGPTEEGSSYHLNNNCWVDRDQTRHCSLINQLCDGLSWGGRIVGRGQVKSYSDGNCGVREEENDVFLNIFERGSLLYCNMSFEALMNVRKHLEELGFPCKAVNDGLWLQMLLSQRVQEIGADTCKNCCFTTISCACRQPFGFSRGSSTGVYRMQEHDPNGPYGKMGNNMYIVDSTQGEINGPYRPVRVHVRGANDGLAGIAMIPPTRLIFSRVPFGMRSRNCQQSLANDDSEVRADQNEDLSGNGLTALVGLSQRGNMPNTHFEQTEMMDSPEDAIGFEWDNAGNSISLDLKTPLIHFPPFRFGVEFEGVHRLSDAQVKHSPEVYYAGSLWKISVQAFSDEDPQGRRTLGLFLHRRKAEITDSLRRVHMFVDSREKVNARYQLICPSKREVVVFGRIKQTGTLLPKAPKGWGWRSALLFDELVNLLQNGSLRVVALVQLV